MKSLGIFMLLFSVRLSSFGQKAEFLKKFNFDSSYSIVCIGQSYQGREDSLSRFWFVLDNPEDMNSLKNGLDAGESTHKFS